MPANAEQGMTCLPANDATGHSFLPETLEALANLARFKLPRTSDPAETSDTFEVLAAPD